VNYMSVVIILGSMRCGAEVLHVCVVLACLVCRRILFIYITSINYRYASCDPGTAFEVQILIAVP
jgi:hypothetical protein